jgi:hypothetical protein
VESEEVHGDVHGEEVVKDVGHRVVIVRC